MMSDPSPAALVTGAAGGIGFAIAGALSAKGFQVALGGLPGDKMLDVAASRLFAPAIAFDVADVDAHRDALDKAETAVGPLTCLVNCAGVGVMSRGDPLEVAAESWDRCLDVNAKAMFFLTQAFARRVIPRPKGATFHSVINVTSSNATAVAEPRGEYCASKAAAAMVSKVWATRLAREGVAVYDIQPGLIETEMTAPVINSYRERAEAGLTLIPRVGQPEDIGQIAATLAAGELPYTTGQTIQADGGMLVPRF